MKNKLLLPIICLVMAGCETRDDKNRALISHYQEACEKLEDPFNKAIEYGCIPLAEYYHSQQGKYLDSENKYFDLVYPKHK